MLVAKLSLHSGQLVGLWVNHANSRSMRSKSTSKSRIEKSIFLTIDTLTGSFSPICFCFDQLFTCFSCWDHATNDASGSKQLISDQNKNKSVLFAAQRNLVKFPETFITFGSSNSRSEEAIAELVSAVKSNLTWTTHFKKKSPSKWHRMDTF